MATCTRYEPRRRFVSIPQAHQSRKNPVITHEIRVTTSSSRWRRVPEYLVFSRDAPESHVAHPLVHIFQALVQGALRVSDVSRYRRRQTCRILVKANFRASSFRCRSRGCARFWFSPNHIYDTGNRMTRPEHIRLHQVRLQRKNDFDFSASPYVYYYILYLYLL